MLQGNKLHGWIEEALIAIERFQKPSNLFFTMFYVLCLIPNFWSVLWSVSSLIIIIIKSLYILELTVGYESNLRTNAERKKQKYRELVQQLTNDYEKVNFVNLSISALGIYDKSTTEFIDMMKMLKFDKRTTNYTIKKITNIAIRTSYYIFCRRNKEWTDPELMTLQYSCVDVFFFFFHQVAIVSYLLSSKVYNCSS